MNGKDTVRALDRGPYEKVSVAGTPRPPIAGFRDTVEALPEGPYSHVEIAGTPGHPLHRRGKMGKTAR